MEMPVRLLCLVCALRLGLAFSAARAADGDDAPPVDFAAMVRSLTTRPPAARPMHFAGGSGVGPYSVHVNNPAVAALMRNVYDADAIRRLADATRRTWRVEATERPWGTFVRAAPFESEDMEEETHYDAVWVRDSLWGFLALKAGDAADDASARRVLLTLWDYMATAPQLRRMADAIDDPSLLLGKEGQMRAVHIRFNSKSVMFDDVEERQGVSQHWTHKQNDALGLLLDTTLAALADGSVTLDDMRANKRFDALVMLFGYLDAAGFWSMEDSGTWEESARLNTSSVALATSAFESLAAALGEDGAAFAAVFRETAGKLGQGRLLGPDYLSFVVEQGYERIRRQLSLGGESPDYWYGDPRYRKSDAALLNLVYPARLRRFSLADKRRVLDLVAPLEGEWGVRRYQGDTYQSGNFWFRGIRTDTDAKTMATRERSFIPGSEAQWFFDSWCAKARLTLYRESGDARDLYLAFRHANRALGQITGDDTPQADGRAAPPAALPESYNCIVADGRLWPAASPIVPLNWAKACMTLMFADFQQTF